MPAHDFRSPRLFVGAELANGRTVPLDAAQSHYVLNVMRREGGEVLVFNGRDGEWRARVEAAGRKAAQLVILAREREQPERGDLHYLFAPLRRGRLDYVVEKAVEMGASRIRPVVTRYVQNQRLRVDKLNANAREAAEQCGVLNVPPVDDPVALGALLDGWDPARRLVFCDEREDVASPIEALGAVEPGPLAVLIGPEGGFAPEERERLAALPFVTAIPLGPRILRADTAGVAALALVQAVVGDWRA